MMIRREAKAIARFCWWQKKELWDHSDWVEGGSEAGETSAQVLRNSQGEFVLKVSEAVQKGQDDEEARRGEIRVTEEDPDSPSTVVGQV